MRVLFLDCFSGISGDMSVAALLDLGVPQEHLAAQLEKLGLSGEYHLHFSRQIRQGIEGVKFDVHHAHSHHHTHVHEHPQEGEGHGHQATSHQSPITSHPTLPVSHSAHSHGRSFRQIRELIEAGALSPFVKTRAIATFRRIAVAEGKIHGMPADDVTFHEVGAIDSIVDILAFCIGIEALGIERVFVSKLLEGTGFIDCAHGRFPLPAPATLEILAGIPLAQIDEPLEFITPTGAALIAEFGEGFGPMPALAPERIGYGVGARDTASRPNVLRAVLGNLVEASGNISAEHDTITQIETNLDDFTPELTGAFCEKLLSLGALDVFLTTAQMKKFRPGILLTVLCDPARAGEFADLVLRETTSFGVRMHECHRRKLRRDFTDVETPYGTVRIKLGYLGDTRIRATPEFESCRKLSESTGHPLEEIYKSAQACSVRL